MEKDEKKGDSAGLILIESYPGDEQSVPNLSLGRARGGRGGGVGGESFCRDGGRGERGGGYNRVLASRSKVNATKRVYAI